ncbi:hypothetical protein NDU88_004887 [Pleurodeles waltl]|uniref:Uncharacterized protein n=1 Tax=Pleurodeles waltl TaxID=8319 RepID=A0AAV7MW77_PLEWA|nr:hypothetical protein NDU88_004887 [Pleurodeles waltl]
MSIPEGQGTVKWIIPVAEELPFLVDAVTQLVLSHPDTWFTLSARAVCEARGVSGSGSQVPGQQRCASAEALKQSGAAHSSPPAPVSLPVLLASAPSLRPHGIALSIARLSAELPSVLPAP